MIAGMIFLDDREAFNGAVLDESRGVGRLAGEDGLLDGIHVSGSNMDAAGSLLRFDFAQQSLACPFEVTVDFLIVEYIHGCPAFFLIAVEEDKGFFLFHKIIPLNTSKYSLKVFGYVAIIAQILSRDK